MTFMPLEHRVLLSVVVEGNIVSITGGRGPDVITIQGASPGLDGPDNYIRVVVNGKEHFAQGASDRDPLRVLVKGGAGDDSLDLNTLYSSVSQLTTKGGKGDDTIRIISGPTLVRGGPGDDRISVDMPDFGRGDSVFGDAGDDTLTGGAGNDLIDGGPGRDVLRGGDESDLEFSIGDTLVGGDGDDILMGGLGHDALFGGAGDDVLNGGGGNDVLKGGPGDDRFFGGSGDDVLYVSKKEKYEPGKGRDEVLQ